MSMYPTAYVIYGYDIEKYVDKQKLSDWQWEDGEKYFVNQSAGHVQIFDDPASGNHIYLGYCIWAYEEFHDMGDIKISISELENKDNFDDVLSELIDNKIMKEDRSVLGEPQVICFSEYR